MFYFSENPEQFIVIYNQKSIFKTINVKSLNDQINIIHNATFSSSFDLNHDGTILLCVVQKGQICKSSKEDNNPVSKDYDMDCHQYRQSWGEKVDSIYHTLIAVIHLELEKVILIEKSDLSLSEQFFYELQNNN